MRKIAILVALLLIGAIAAAGCTTPMPADNNQIPETVNATNTTTVVATATKIVTPSPTVVPTLTPTATPTPAPTQTDLRGHQHYPSAVIQPTRIFFRAMYSPFMYDNITAGSTFEAAVQLQNGTGAAFCGSVSFYVDGTYQGITPVAPPGSPCLAEALLLHAPEIVGTATISAQYGGDAMHEPAEVTAVFQVIA